MEGVGRKLDHGNPNLSPPESSRAGSFIWIITLDKQIPQRRDSIRNCVRGTVLPQFLGFSRRTQKTQHIVVLTAFITVKGYKIKSATGKCVWSDLQRKNRQSCLASSLRSHTHILMSSANNFDNTC